MRKHREIVELRNLGPEELERRLGESRQELFNLRLRLATRQLTNHRELPRVRRRIAGILTIMRERALAAEYEAMTEDKG